MKRSGFFHQSSTSPDDTQPIPTNRLFSRQQESEPSGSSSQAPSPPSGQLNTIKTPNGLCTAVATNDEYLVEQVEALQSGYDDINQWKTVEPTPIRVVGEAEAVHEDGEFVSTLVKDIDHIKPINQNQYKRGMLKTAVNTLKRIEEVDVSRPGVEDLDEHEANAKAVLDHIRSMD
jgi:hypothetical protein